MWRGGGRNPADGGDACLDVGMFDGLDSKVGLDRASSIGDSYRVCIVEALLACKECPPLDEATTVSPDHCRPLPLSVVFER